MRAASSPPAPQAGIEVSPPGAPSSYFELLLTYKCDARCRFCSQDLEWRRWRGLTLREASESVFKARRRGSTVLGLIGGEPTRWPGVEKLAAFAKRVGFTDIRMTTNGVRFADARFARSLARNGLRKVTVSIHGPTAKLHDDLVELPGAFERLTAGVAHLRAAGVDVAATIVVNRRNCRSLRAFFHELLPRLGIVGSSVTYPIRSGDYLDHERELELPISAAARWIRRAVEGLPPERRPVIVNIPPCLLPEASGRTTRSGSYVESGRPEQAFDSHRGVFGPECGRCVLRRSCLGVDPSYAALRGWSEFRPAAA